jgi:hypothetical protein
MEAAEFFQNVGNHLQGYTIITQKTTVQKKLISLICIHVLTKHTSLALLSVNAYLKTFDIQSREIFPSEMEMADVQVNKIC